MYRLLLIIIPLHIVYFAFVCRLFILWGTFVVFQIIIINDDDDDDDVNIPLRQMSRLTFI